MTTTDIRQMRLLNQHLSSPFYTKAADIVYHLGAIQSQDYAGAKWAIAQRLIGARQGVIEQAFSSGEFLRTHVLRPTWHFVHPKDIRWMLELTAPRIMAARRTQHRQFQLDNAIFRKCEKIIGQAMQGGKQLTRNESAEVLRRKGIATNEQRMIHIMMQMELLGLICSGGRQGKQFTYALLDERVRPAEALDRQEALAMLAGRYFISHGPASIADYAWWSGLTLADARMGLELIKHKLSSAIYQGSTYWYGQQAHAIKARSPAALLLANYDEYIVSYKDREAVIAASDVNKTDPRGTIFNHTMIAKGKVVGTWKHHIAEKKVNLQLRPFSPLKKGNQVAFAGAAKRFSGYLDLASFTFDISGA